MCILPPNAPDADGENLTRQMDMTSTSNNIMSSCKSCSNQAHSGTAQARQIESELEAKTTAFGKLCSGPDGYYRARGESGLAAEQVSAE